MVQKLCQAPIALVLTGFALLAVIASRADAAQSRFFERALSYEHGEGVKQSYAAALRLYCQAASEGDERAAFNIGWMYLNGRGVPRNDAQGAAWLKRSAASGTLQARNLLKLLAHTQAAKSARCPTSFSTAGIPAVPYDIKTAVAGEAARAKLDPNLVLSVMAAESAFNIAAISPKNAQGLMQLIPETAARYDVADPFDMHQNIRGGVAYLSELLSLYDGDIDLTLAAYNAGEKAVSRHNGIPPFPETIDYVQRVKAIYTKAPILFADRRGERGN